MDSYQSTRALHRSGQPIAPSQHYSTAVAITQRVVSGLVVAHDMFLKDDAHQADDAATIDLQTRVFRDPCLAAAILYHFSFACDHNGRGHSCWSRISASQLPEQ